MLPKCLGALFTNSKRCNTAKRWVDPHQQRGMALSSATNYRYEWYLQTRVQYGATALYYIMWWSTREVNEVIITPFLWCSPHERPLVRVPEETTEVFTFLPTRPLLLQGGHGETFSSLHSTSPFTSLPLPLTGKWNPNICFSSLLPVPPQIIGGPFSRELMSWPLSHSLLQSFKLKLPGRRSRVWWTRYLVFTIYKAKIRWACWQ